MSVETIYAEALYEAAADQGVVAGVARDLDQFIEALDGTPELERVLDNPEIETGHKKAAVAALMGESSPLVASFLQVLLDRGRIVELRAVAAAFAERVAEAERRVAVEAVTAIPLSPELRERIARRVADETGREVDLTETLDPDIVGGLMLRAGGVVVDGSVRQRLAGLRQALAAAPVDAAP